MKETHQNEKKMRKNTICYKTMAIKVSQNKNYFGCFLMNNLSHLFLFWGAMSEGTFTHFHLFFFCTPVQNTNSNVICNRAITVAQI